MAIIRVCLSQFCAGAKRGFVLDARSNGSDDCHVAVWSVRFQACEVLNF